MRDDLDTIGSNAPATERKVVALASFLWPLNRLFRRPQRLVEIEPYTMILLAEEARKAGRIEAAKRLIEKAYGLCDHYSR
jgi:hypothetical protein